MSDTINTKEFIMEFSHRAKEVVDASTEILGFNPKSTKEEIFPVMMTPTMAKHILANHNNRNRKIVPAQRNEISKSVTAFGWLFTGDSCAFDITGNLTEFQHRLEEIANGLETRLVHVATGVKSDTFTKAAPAKNRTKFDVIWRDDSKELILIDIDSFQFKSYIPISYLNNVFIQQLENYLRWK